LAEILIAVKARKPINKIKLNCLLMFILDFVALSIETGRSTDVSH